MRIYSTAIRKRYLVFPGNLGIFEWGGISVNQDEQVYGNELYYLAFYLKTC